MTQLLVKIKNTERKEFRISNNYSACRGFHPLWFKIEQKYTLLFFFHWWGTPTFDPPHSFRYYDDALKCIKEHYPNAIVYDNKCKD